MEERFITLVIHSIKRALPLKNILENHGIEVRLMDLQSPFDTELHPVRVKIPEKKLPLALKIIESGEAYSPAAVEMKMAGMSGNMLIPVDFSQSSILSCKVGFSVASELALHPVLLHTYVGPIYAPDSMIADGIQDNAPVVEEMEQSEEIEEVTWKVMNDFKRKIKSYQNTGDLKDINFSAVVTEGVPEDVIIEYSKEYKPSLIVMATRGKDKKEEELIGSVTAEVLDSCRVPVLTVPENYTFRPLKEIKKLVLFCNLDQQDIIVVDSLMKMFGFPEVEIYLVPVNERSGAKVSSRLETLLEFFNVNYPTAVFRKNDIPFKNFRSDFGKFIEDNKIELLIVPNKKTNIFNRIFRPTIAHKCLFERDMPMLVIPV